MFKYDKLHISPPNSPTTVSAPLSPTSSTISNGSSPGGVLHRTASTDSTRDQARLTATAKRHKYLRRLLRFKQMDFEYAFWQMLYLFVSPQKVYRNFQYRKQTKDQWARDDPAFLVLLSAGLLVSSIGFSIGLGLSFVGFIKFLFWVIFVDCIGVGLFIATQFWFITNRYMILNPPRGQDVEWAYAFDVHLNAFFPLLMILHLFQTLILSWWHGDHFISLFIGNTIWLIAIGYYIYITFLGYSALPFLKNTRKLLYPYTAVIFVYILSLIFNWNFNSALWSFYQHRVGGV